MSRLNKKRIGHSMYWDLSLIEEIHAQKLQEKSSDRDNSLNLISMRLYAEKEHYALELIQNAEDECSESIAFIFDKKSLVVINDGEPFDDDDVWGICSVRPGRKKNKVGFFGIGFKSVFNVTSRPQVISSKFNFAIKDFVYPEPKQEIPEEAKGCFDPSKGSVFVLPFEEGLAQREGLLENLNTIDAKILLFLRNLKSLKVIDRTTDREWVLEKHVLEPGIIRIEDSRDENASTWRVFETPLNITDPRLVPEGKQGVTETAITVAFPVDEEVIEALRTRGVIYCYLPTKQRSDLPFLIQADFLPTIGREQIHVNSWNVWLMKELGRFAAECLEKLNVEDLSKYIYAFIPMSNEISDGLIQHLYRSLAEGLKTKKVSKSGDGWILPSKCAIPESWKIRNVVEMNDLRKLDMNLAYLDWEFLEEKQLDRAQQVLLELGAVSVDCNVVVEFIEKTRCRDKSPEWFLALYEYLSEYFEVKHTYGDDFTWSWSDDKKELFERLSVASFILTTGNKVIPLVDKDKTDKMICYPQRISMSEIQEVFSEGEIVFLHRYLDEQSTENEELRTIKNEVKDWFEQIGVRRYLRQSNVIKDVILPKFDTGKFREYDDLKQYKLINYIRTNWSALLSEVKSSRRTAGFLDEIKKSLFLKCFGIRRGKKVEDYKKPDELYFTKRYGKAEFMEDLFKGVSGIHYISPYYLNRDKHEQREKKKGRQKDIPSWKKFFEELGLWSVPRVEELDEWMPLNEMHDWINRKYSPHSVHEVKGDCWSPDIVHLLELCSKMKSTNSATKRIQLLWSGLEKGWSRYEQISITNSQYRFAHMKREEYYYTYDSYYTTSLLEVLKAARWIPDESGKFCVPGEVYPATKENKQLLENSARFTLLTGKKELADAIGLRLEPRIEDVLDHIIDFRKSALPETAALNKMNTVYSFLARTLEKLAYDEKPGVRSKLKRALEEHELLYLPLKHKRWWKPSQVFWRDVSEWFKIHRGYVDFKGRFAYDTGLRDFFFDSLGVIAEPLLTDCFAFLEELKTDVNDFRKYAPDVYRYIDDLLRRKPEEEEDWDNDLFLSRKSNFLAPSGLYWSDSSDLRESFRNKIEFLFVPFPLSQIQRFLEIGGFRPLEKSVSIGKDFGKISEGEGGKTIQLRNIIDYSLRYISMHHPSLYDILRRNGIRMKIEEIQFFATEKMILEYVLNYNEKPVKVRNDNKLAYYSVEENRLYVYGVDIFSTESAKELSILFSPAHQEVLSFLMNLMNCESEAELRARVKTFGLEADDILSNKSESIVEVDEHADDDVEVGKTAKKESTQGKGQKPTSKTKNLPTLAAPGRRSGNHDLVNPEEIIFYEIEESESHTSTDGTANFPKRKVQLRAGSPSSGTRISRPAGANPGDAESVALMLVEIFETMEQRQSDDRHSQLGIGYDVYSEGENSEERFIEVKHFRGEASAWGLTPHQWKKATQEKDNYFVYVVSRIIKGNQPILEIIQNPVKYLTPDLPAKKSFSKWKSGVRQTVRSNNKAKIN